MINRQIALNGGARPASEYAELARRALDMELGFAIQDQMRGPGPKADEANAVYADYYQLAARHDGAPLLEKEDRERLIAEGRSDRHMYLLDLMIRFNESSQPLSDRHLELQLEQLGVHYDERHNPGDRRVVLEAWSLAQRLAPLINHPQVQAQSSPIAFLLEKGPELVQRLPATRPGGAPAAQVPPVEPVAADEEHAEIATDPSATSSAPLLREVIPDVVAGLVRRGSWKEGKGATAEDATRLLKQFCWMIGNLPVDQYSQRHLAQFESEMMAMPKSVRVQTVWNKPYAQAKKAFPALTAANKRQGRTMNKDLAYLSTFADRMVDVGLWKADQMKPLALAHEVSTKHKAKVKAPWRPEHIGTMLASPIYHGNGGSKRRLKKGEWINQDAAYWVLLLAIYTSACQNEICGLLVDDVVSGPDMIPHIVFAENRLRTLKRDARERTVPLHPRLIDLGFIDYVEAIRAQGGDEVFPELWIYEGKRGGDQYRAIVWDKLIAWMRASGTEIPAGVTGKPADFHSLRSMVLSLLDRAGINQNIVKDIAGHAREGVTAGTYQDLVASGGLQDALGERLEVLMRLPDFAADLKARPPVLLPLSLRSR